jgi:hypothetical protein
MELELTKPDILDVRFKQKCEAFQNTAHLSGRNHVLEFLRLHRHNARKLILFAVSEKRPSSTV